MPDVQRLIAQLKQRYKQSGLTGVVKATLAVTRRTIGQALSPMPPPSFPESIGHPITYALDWLSERNSFSIVQIGAYVGDTPNDPLSTFFHQNLRAVESRNAKVVVVEPIKEYFDKLRHNYQMLHGIEFENVAIAKEDGDCDFYHLAIDPSAADCPDWLLQLGCLREDRMTVLWDSYEQKQPGTRQEWKQFYLNNRTVEKVRCMKIETLLSLHGIDDLDLLQMDTEGYDFEILKSIDFQRIRPRFINYERVLLTHQETESCRRLLTKAGYMLIDTYQDTFCIRVA